MRSIYEWTSFIISIYLSFSLDNLISSNIGFVDCIGCKSELAILDYPLGFFYFLLSGGIYYIGISHWIEKYIFKEDGVDFGNELINIFFSICFVFLFLNGVNNNI